MIEQLLQNHLEELRIIRENARRSTAERGVGPDAGGDEGEGGEDADGGNDEGEAIELPDLEGILVAALAPEQPPPIPQPRERSRSPPQEYHGMYS